MAPSRPKNMSDSYLSDSHKNILLEAHEDRLRNLERGFNELTSQILPAMARLETVVTAGFERVNESMERGEHRFDEIEDALGGIKKSAGEDTARDLQRDVALTTLQKIEADRVEKSKVVKKWFLGILAGVAVGALSAFLGLK